MGHPGPWLITWGNIIACCFLSFMPQVVQKILSFTIIFLFLVLFIEANHLRCIMILIKLSRFQKSRRIKQILSINQSTNSVVFVNAVMINNYIYGNAIPTVLPHWAGDSFWRDWFITSRLSKDNTYFNTALLFVRFGSYVTVFVNLLDLLGFLRNKTMKKKEIKQCILSVHLQCIRFSLSITCVWLVKSSMKPLSFSWVLGADPLRIWVSSGAGNKSRVIFFLTRQILRVLSYARNLSDITFNFSP